MLQYRMHYVSEFGVSDERTPELLPLHLAAMEGDADTVRKLLRDGTDINAADEKGYTALTYAVEGDRVNCMEALGESANLNLNPIDNDGTTPLMIATSFGNTHAVQWLLDKGANRDITDGDEKTAMDFAEKVEIVKLLQTLPIMPDAPARAAGGGSNNKRTKRKSRKRKSRSKSRRKSRKRIKRIKRKSSKRIKRKSTKRRKSKRKRRSRN